MPVFAQPFHYLRRILEARELLESCPLVGDPDSEWAERAEEYLAKKTPPVQAMFLDDRRSGKGYVVHIDYGEFDLQLRDGALHIAVTDPEPVWDVVYVQGNSLPYAVKCGRTTLALTTSEEKARAILEVLQDEEQA